MQPLLALSRAIDGLSRTVGVFATYLVLLAALVSAFNAFARYSINSLIHLQRQFDRPVLGQLVDLYRLNSNTLGEAQWYMFAGMVMFGAAHTLRMNEHVRIDVPRMGLVKAQVRWALGGNAGTRFLVERES